VEDGRGKKGQVIFVGTEPLRLPRVWEGLGIYLGGAEHLAEFGFVEWAVDGGVDVLLRWRGGLSGQWGCVRGGPGWGGRAHRLDGRGGLASCREALRMGRGGRGARSEGGGASHGGPGCHPM